MECCLVWQLLDRNTWCHTELRTILWKGFAYVAMHCDCAPAVVLFNHCNMFCWLNYICCIILDDEIEVALETSLALSFTSNIFAHLSKEPIEAISFNDRLLTFPNVNIILSSRTRCRFSWGESQDRLGRKTAAAVAVEMPDAKEIQTFISFLFRVWRHTFFSFFYSCRRDTQMATVATCRHFGVPNQRVCVVLSSSDAHDV